MSPIKNSHFSSVKCTLLLLAVFATLVSEVIPSALAVQPEGHLTTCDEQGIIRIPLAQSWERVSSNHPQALCVFRSKDVGFPTLTVVRTTPIATRDIATNAGKIEYLEKSYRAVGIPNAKANNVQSIDNGTLQGYSAVVSFTTQAGALKALVSVFELPDRSYIVTLLDRAEGFESSKGALYEVAEGVKIKDLTPRSSTRPPENKGGESTAWPLLLVATVALILGTAIWINRVKRP